MTHTEFPFVPKAPTLTELLMTTMGYAISSTGGGCTAYMKETKDGHLVTITREDDPLEHPTKVEEPILLSVEAKDGSSYSTYRYKSTTALYHSWLGV
jgi:hypothetical protein